MVTTFDLKGYCPAGPDTPATVGRLGRCETLADLQAGATSTLLAVVPRDSLERIGDENLCSLLAFAGYNADALGDAIQVALCGCDSDECDAGLMAFEKKAYGILYDSVGICSRPAALDIDWIVDDRQSKTMGYAGPVREDVAALAAQRLAYTSFIVMEHAAHRGVEKAVKAALGVDRLWYFLDCPASSLGYGLLISADEYPDKIREDNGKFGYMDGTHHCNSVWALEMPAKERLLEHPVFQEAALLEKHCSGVGQIWEDYFTKLYRDIRADDGVDGGLAREFRRQFAQAVRYSSHADAGSIGRARGVDKLVKAYIELGIPVDDLIG